jgi:hypothetical protein
VTIKERVYYIINGKPSPYCANGKKKTFRPKSNDYGFCDNIKRCECFQKHAENNHVQQDMQHVAEARKSTWLKKYGVDNASKSTTVKNKRKKTMESRNYSHIYNKLAHEKETVGFEQVIDRVAQRVHPLFTREEYVGSNRANKYPWQCNTCANQFESHIDYGTLPRCPICYPKTVSSAEIALAAFIRSLCTNVITNTKDILKTQELDIYLPDKKLAVEYNGVYWHSSDLKTPDYHVNKYLRCKELGIHLIQIFEDEWIRSPEIVKNRLSNIIGTSTKIGARNCVVKKLTTDEYKKFVNSHHLAGYAHSTFKYGLVMGNEIKAVMGFSKSRYSKEGYELIRYCSSDTVIGGAGKLLSHFKKTHNPECIVTYADRCWSNGRLYEELGFTNITSNENNTGYWYIKNNIRYHRSNFTKSRLVKMGHDIALTESVIMRDMGYIKIYNCGNYKFLWRP